MSDLLVLPEFGLMNRQPKVPHVAHVIMRRDVPNEYGTPITYTVQQGRNGKDWWIGASREGRALKPPSARSLSRFPSRRLFLIG